ncbi:microtubule-associated proteins 1A/1B light chain 3C-like isoform X2 [Oryctolagus cuniculus]|uniref:microtubule-associated proteins 1A/1B light chain 3C-like isoform X2 n=1 Tax=Oryctolagus cuniculus TaxID=9986 RepID=UPI003879879D
MPPLQKNPSLTPFKQRKSLATRQEEVAGIREKFPNKIPVRLTILPQRGLYLFFEERKIKQRPSPLFQVPKILGALSHILRHLPQERPMLILLAVIVERYPREKLLSLLDKTKFLVPQELTMSQFLSIIRSRMVLRATEAFYLLVDNKSLVSMSMTMAEIYQDYKDKDGFVYMTYASQEMFGCSELAAPSSGSSHRNRPEIPFSLCQEKLVL